MNRGTEVGIALQRMESWLRHKLRRRQIRWQDQDDIIQLVRTKLWLEITRKDPLPSFCGLNNYYLGMTSISNFEIDSQLRRVSMMKWQISEHFGRKHNRINLMFMPADNATLLSISSRKNDYRILDSYEELNSVCRTEREQRVLDLYVADFSSSQIAEALGIERTTVNRTLKRLAQRLSARNN